MRRTLAQPGPQTACLQSNANNVIYGGAAGGGKTRALVMAAMRYIHIPDYRACIIRCGKEEIYKSGGLFEEAFKLYKIFGAEKKVQSLKMVFPTGAVIQFISLKTDEDVERFLGFSYDFIGWDEVQLADKENWIWDVQSRLRTTIKEIKPQMICTCNPYPNWLADFLEGWLQEDGYADYSKANLKRWVLRIREKKYWFASREETMKYKFDKFPDSKALPTSVTFIPAKLTDNKILMDNDPAYEGRLASGSFIEEERKLKGNWKISAEGSVFDVRDFKHFDLIPADVDAGIIIVDTALATEEVNDWTVFEYWVRADNKSYFVAQLRGKWDFHTQLLTLISFFNKYKPTLGIYGEQAAMGIPLATECRRQGIPFFPIARGRSKAGAPKYMRGKLLRAQPVISYIRGGFVFINPAADYFVDFVKEVSTFSYTEVGGTHDDQVDCMIDAVTLLLVEKLGAVEEEVEDSEYLAELDDGGGHSFKGAFSS